MSWLVVLILTILNEAVIEYLVGNIQSLKPYIPLLSLATAILLTFAFQVSLFNVILGTHIRSPFWEFLLSAIIIARLSNYLNDLAQKLLGSK
ncbi:MAG: hypothetical protein NUV73_03600 [Candidatus Daviesbacteria bacterium]|nr:hypothetical protein [Candidatus Daviesbacteria bacterium]